MKIVFLVISIIFILSGCLKTKETKRTLSSNQEEAQLYKDCSEINNIGDVRELVAKVNTDANKIHALSSEENPYKNLNEINLISDELTNTIMKLKTLLKSEWVEPKMNLYGTWVITSNDLLSPLFINPKQIDIVQVIPHSFIYDGAEVPNLEQILKFKNEGSQLIVNLMKPSGSIEMCSLIRTMAILLTVKYHAEWYSGYKKDGEVSFKLIFEQGAKSDKSID